MTRWVLLVSLLATVPLFLMLVFTGQTCTGCSGCSIVTSGTSGPSPRTTMTFSIGLGPGGIRQPATGWNPRVTFAAPTLSELRLGPQGSGWVGQVHAAAAPSGIYMFTFTIDCEYLGTVSSPSVSGQVDWTAGARTVATTLELVLPSTGGASLHPALRAPSSV